MSLVKKFRRSPRQNTLCVAPRRMTPLLQATLLCPIQYWRSADRSHFPHRVYESQPSVPLLVGTPLMPLRLICTSTRSYDPRRQCHQRCDRGIARYPPTCRGDSTESLSRIILPDAYPCHHRGSIQNKSDLEKLTLRLYLLLYHLDNAPNSRTFFEKIMRRHSLKYVMSNCTFVCRSGIC